MRYPRACVPHLYALLVGSVKIQPGLRNYDVTCNNCTLTNCVRGITNRTRVLVLRQPAFVMVPVKINGSWYDEKGLELWREVEGALMRYRRGIGLIILGFVALVTLIASSITAALTLAQSVQTATCVNNLAQNVSVTLGTQEDIDKKLEDRLNALYDDVKFLGEEVQSIKLRLRVQCHADFRWICVTPKKYNGSITAWDKVKAHLEGIWHNENISLHLLHLHQEIMNIENAPRPDLDVAKRAESFVKELFRHVPTIDSILYLGVAIGGLFLIILTVLFLAPCLIKKLIDDLWIIKASIYGNCLRLKEHKRAPI
ncbi:endogenous retrovirus group K member 13-1 Env polyprotein-like [Bubalus kerabau]|uniref:endogenous retrovirus group K member 13-1 Env polyprotein-like n=1 Tax=Bubalus carabanensis TaxID=3119969 RepID=UPI00244E6B9B|nr:endogenous retrovirus group K member 13-1 Env polyprotein-like [Bubalus carabanensis]XP_055438901.1 endogenous retrovirus group K member 13-1 Env polyprotein-like [Bubalus carabanensis]XP_055438902.1 endogenous retrovirus group K member 13-1 Env polyprotein-like [Bubalus carabanensis]XP_055438903.1 endogenous retrovirus group K member 13-1 Env polyprotein-like [Bubalus carabanensis]XP_055438904.1 endogenous retrovirus group K member 13-1 Env polyprotein-like [Bubalus carabanensis]